VLCLILITATYSQTDLYNLVDHDSFITKEISMRRLEDGISVMKSAPIESFSSLKSSFHLHPNILALENSIWILELFGRGDEDYHLKLNVDEKFQEKLKIIRSLIGSGRSENSKGNFKLAISYFDAVLQLCPFHPEALFLKGSSFERLGKVDIAAVLCKRSLQFNPIYTKSMLNLASFNHKYGQIEDSILLYEEGVELYELFANLQPERYVLHDDFVKMSANLALAYFQQGNLMQAITEIESLSKSLVHGLQMLSHNENYELGSNDINQGKFIRDSLTMLRGNEVIIKRSVCMWERWEENYVRIKDDSLIFIESQSVYFGPLLPFDTLLFHVSLPERLIIAKATAQYHQYAVQSYQLQSSEIAVELENLQPLCVYLKIGLISYDFNDHPTTRLIEGIFRIITDYRSRYNDNEIGECPWYKSAKIFVFSYGKHDNSKYRIALESLADKFYDIITFSHEEAASLIFNSDLDALLEMQLHTLGNRLEITALKPCPLVINYLVYPGTSGATFVDYLFADRIVVPVEQVLHYSESLIYVAPTYQISYYDDHNDYIGSGILSSSVDFSCETKYCHISIHALIEKKRQLRR